MVRKASPSDRRMRKWTGAHAEYCDAQVRVCLATLTTEGDPAKRLRMATGLLAEVETLRAIKRAAVLELVAAGWTQSRIGSVWGVRASTVNQTLNRVRPFPRPGKTDKPT